MNQFQKWTTFIIRVIALSAAVINVIRLVVDTVELQPLEPSLLRDLAQNHLIVVFVYIVASVIVYALASTFGREVSKDLND